VAPDIACVARFTTSAYDSRHTRKRGGIMMEHDEMFEVLEVEEPTVVAMSMSMSFVAVDEDADDK
jgi:hypothetical protein